MTYAGPRRAAKPSQILDYQRRGWVAEEKVDGCYAELHVGRCARCGASAIRAAIYRSGAFVTGASGRDVLGLHVPWSAGTIVAAELMVRTPAAARWQAAHGGIVGAVLLDLLAEGVADELPADVVAVTIATVGHLPRIDWSRRPNADRRARLEELAAPLEGPAARALCLVERRQRGLRAFWGEVVDRGGEGLVLKDPRARAGAGVLKIKRVDTIDCRVASLHPEQGVVGLRHGSNGPRFFASTPRFPVALGQLVEVASTGFYDGGEGGWIPRHARILRTREDVDLGTWAPQTS